MPDITVMFPAGGTRDFGSIEGMKKWVEDEKRKWKWLNDQSDVAGLSVRVVSRLIDERFNKLTDNLQTALVNGNIEAAIKEMQTAFGAGGIPSPDSLVYKRLMDEKIALAQRVIELRFYMRAQVNPHLNTEETRGLVSAVLAEKGFDPEWVSSAKEAVETVHQEGLEFLTELKKERQKVQTELEGFKRAIKEDTKIHGLREFWRSKKRTHIIIGICGGTLFILIAIAGLGWGVPAFIEKVSAAMLALNGDAASTQDNSWSSVKELITRSSIIGLSIAVFVWLLRLVSRITMSQVHLATDAAHRSTLIQTYLGLLKETGSAKGAVTEDQRTLVLEAIFRQIGTGLIKTDIVPSSMVYEREST